MSDGLQLSDELMNSLHNAIIKYDERASDPNVLVQYLAASLGFVLGNVELDLAEKENYLQQLSGFAGNVLKDVHVKSQPAEDTNAVGVKMWKP